MRHNSDLWGSTSVGLFAIQLAQSAGYTVVATASPHSFDLVKKYGAHCAFDYRSTTAVQDIVKALPNITQALDCISEGRSTELCAQVIEKNGGKVVTLFDQDKSKVHGVKYDFLLVFTAFGHKFEFIPPIGPSFPAPSDREALVRFYANLPQLVKGVKNFFIRYYLSINKTVMRAIKTLEVVLYSGILNDRSRL